MSDREPKVTLEEYAVVVAALGARLPLQRAVELVGLAPRDWGPASQHWMSKIQESAASDRVTQAAFDAALLDAKSRFEPRCAPIDSDPEAWAELRKHFLAADNPPVFLADLGIPLAVYDRLETDWARKIAGDPSVAAAVKRRTAAPLGPCPEITVIPSPLLRGDAVLASPPLVEAPPPPPSVPVAPPASVPVGPPASVPVGPPASVPVGPPASVPVAPPASVPVVAPVSMPVAASPPVPGPVPVRVETSGLPADLRERIARGALPFAKSRAGAAASAPRATPSPAGAPPASNRPVTAPVQEHRRNTALPFSASPAALSASPAVGAPAGGQSAAPSASPVAGGPPAGGQSAASGPGAHAGTVRSVPVLTLEHYASLCAELAVIPARTEAVFARYGLATQQDRLTVDLAWQERLRRDPAAYRQWYTLYARYQAYWTEHHRRGSGST